MPPMERGSNGNASSTFLLNEDIRLVAKQSYTLPNSLLILAE